MRRGDLVTVAVSGDCDKPRQALVIQSDALAETDSILDCLLTKTLRDAPLYRLPVAALPAAGLRAPSQIMVDKIFAVPRVRCGAVIGRVDDTILSALRPLLALAGGIADQHYRRPGGSRTLFFWKRNEWLG